MYAHYIPLQQSIDKALFKIFLKSEAFETSPTFKPELFHPVEGGKTFINGLAKRLEKQILAPCNKTDWQVRHSGSSCKRFYDNFVFCIHTFLPRVMMNFNQPMFSGSISTTLDSFQWHCTFNWRHMRRYYHLLLAKIHLRWKRTRLELWTRHEMIAQNLYRLYFIVQYDLVRNVQKNTPGCTPLSHYNANREHLHQLESRSIN